MASLWRNFWLFTFVAAIFGLIMTALRGGRR